MEANETAKESTAAAIRRKVSKSRPRKGTLTTDEPPLPISPSAAALSSISTNNTTTNATSSSSGKKFQIFARRASVSSGNSSTKSILSDFKLAKVDSSLTQRPVAPPSPVETSSNSYSSPQQTSPAIGKRRNPQRPPSGHYPPPTLNAANDLDQAQFFHENAEEVFDVTYKAFMNQVDKIKDKSDRPMSFSAKEFININKSLVLLRKIFLFLPDLIKNGWQRMYIAHIINHLLDHGNHPRVRSQGFHLLLLWMNDQTTEFSECINLYANSISLDLFVYDQFASVENADYRTNSGLFELGQEFIRADDRGPLFSNPYPPTFNDSVSLLKIALTNIARLAHVAAGSDPPSENYDSAVTDNIEPDNGIAIGIGIDAALAAAKFNYELLKKYYLVKLFPACSKKLGISTDAKHESGFSSCPPAILRAFIQFFIDYCLDNTFGSTELVTTFPSPATPILKSIVLAFENREIAHEIIRQALMLPAGSTSTKDIVRGAVHIVGVWILSGEEERPVFLRKTASTTATTVYNQNSSVSMSSSSSTETLKTLPLSSSGSVNSHITNYADANVYLRRYIKLLTLVFDDHSFVNIDGGMTNTEVEAQVSIYRDVLSLYRAIIGNGPIELENETWESLLVCLLEIQRKTMNQSEKYGPIPSVHLAHELADYLVETILMAFARSMSTQADLWQGLSNQMKESTRWSQTILQWKRTMDRLTKILSKYLYQVDLEAVDLNRRPSELSISERHRRKPSKNRTRHLSLKDLRHKSSGSNSSREEIVSPDYSSAKSASEHRTTRRAASMHQDDSKLLGGQALLSFVNGFSASSEMPAEENSGVKSNRTSTSSAFFAQPNFSSDRISSSLANFKSSEFIPPNHADAIKCLVQLWDTLNLIRNNQPYSDVSLPLLYEFAPWFLEACDMPLAFAPGRALAYGGICKMMSRQQDQEVSSIYYSHFYRSLLKGLSDTDTSITHAIINNSTKLFAQALPGSNILFYRFIESILNLLTKHDRAHLPESTRQNAITILCSLICILNQNPDLKVPIIPYYKLTKLKVIDLNNSSFDLTDSISCSELRLILVETLVQTLATEENIHNPDTHIMVLQGICTLAFDEVTSTPSPAKTIVKECFSAIFDQLYWSHLPVVCAAANCLIVFAQNCGLTWDDDGMYLMVLQDVFGNLIGAINEHLNLQRGAQRNGRGFIIAKLFYCLLEWLMVLPPKLFTDTELYQLVFEAIDLAFEVTGHYFEQNDSPRYHEKLLPIPPNKSRGKCHSHDATVRFKKAERKISLSGSLNNEHGVHVVGAEGIEDPELVKDVAECVLLHLTRHLDNFAPLHGPAMINSNLVGPMGDTREEENQENYHFFSLNNTNIITLIEIPGDVTSIARLMVRDATGRYAWDLKLFYKASLDDSSNVHAGGLRYVGVADHFSFRQNIKIEKLMETNKTDKEKTTSKQHSSSQSENLDSTSDNNIPTWTENNNNSEDNMLKKLLGYIGENHPDCEEFPGINQLSNLNESACDTDPALSRIENQLDRHIKEEARYRTAMDPHAKSWYDSVISIRNDIFHVCETNKLAIKFSKTPIYSRSTSHLSLGADFSLSRSFLPVLPPGAEKPNEPYQQCRLFLSHFGLLGLETLKENPIHLLNKTPAFFRDIRLLDKKHAREVVKIALIYVGPGQEDEQSILHNTNGSPMYEEFVASLGWEIDLATHPGYLGGLERNSTNGATATYYCSSTLEIIYHNVIKMPTDPTDPKQLKKKRHIGNDHVHIVWNEHYRDYRHNTIGGDFGNVQIVITPLSNGMFAVNLSRDQKIPLFGPLLNGMVISRNVLGSLVRMTAVQAFRNCLHHINAPSNTMFQHPYMERLVDITKITGRHKNNKSNALETFMSRIFINEEDSTV
ncbi:11696_t:CDS:10 [Ambispora gerdemannii]|uniref:11696_t:CDS:1 n=1 Tax=Ambispora gerdemannii TaxID=144530 RepID=A0A9N9BG89_9GLOM|nr:11696_t:CDS:10 [Ambispora gerdemannii]